MKGFDQLLDTCRRLGVTVQRGPAVPSVPTTILGTRLDPELAQFYAVHNGARFSLNAWRLTIFALHGEEDLAYHNTGLRKLSNDYAEPYPFEDLLVFGQKGLQASYFATVPGAANEAGLQPVVLVDVHEDPWAVPIASSLDAAFTLLARYLEIGGNRGGPDRLPDVEFPLEVPQLVADDPRLRTLVQSGKFDAIVRGDTSIRKWMRATFDRP